MSRMAKVAMPASATTTNPFTIMCPVFITHYLTHLSHITNTFLVKLRSRVPPKKGLRGMRRFGNSQFPFWLGEIRNRQKGNHDMLVGRSYPLNPRTVPKVQT